MQFTTEQIKKAKTAKSVEELLAMAQAENYPMTEEEAQKIFAELHKQGELSDDELDAVAGGIKIGAAVAGGSKIEPFATTGSSTCPYEPDQNFTCMYCRYFTPNDSNNKEGWGNCRWDGTPHC